MDDATIIMIIPILALGALLVASMAVNLWMGVRMQKLNDAIAALNAAITALQGRVVGSVPVAQVEAAADQINAAATTLGTIAT